MRLDTNLITTQFARAPAETAPTKWGASTNHTLNNQRTHNLTVVPNPSGPLKGQVVRVAREKTRLHMLTRSNHAAAPPNTSDPIWGHLVEVAPNISPDCTRKRVRSMPYQPVGP